jgi:hypothetical protein
VNVVLLGLPVGVVTPRRRKAGNHRPDVPWTVLAGPEGNEFRVLTPR